MRVSEEIGERYLKKKMPIFLIWREYLNNGHYLVCYPKDTSKINEIIDMPSNSKYENTLLFKSTT